MAKLDSTIIYGSLIVQDGIIGDATSAGKLTNPVSLTIGNTAKSFDGVTPLTYNASEMGVLPLTGGTLTGPLVLTGEGSNIRLPNNYGVQGTLTNGSGAYMMYMGTNDYIYLSYEGRPIYTNGRMNINGQLDINGPLTVPVSTDPAVTSTIIAASGMAIPIISHMYGDGNGSRTIVSATGGNLLLTSGEAFNGRAGVAPNDENITMMSDTGVAIYVGQQDGFIDRKVTVNTDATISCVKVYNAVFNDYAEYFPKKFMYETKPGDIIALDESGNEETYVLATEKHKVIVGVHSDDYGHLIGGEVQPPDYTYEEWNKDKFIPVGLAGRVRVKFTGIAKKGMKVVPSAVPGIGREFNPEIDSEDSVIGYLVENNSIKTVKRVKMKIK